MAETELGSRVSHLGVGLQAVPRFELISRFDPRLVLADDPFLGLGDPPTTSPLLLHSIGENRSDAHRIGLHQRHAHVLGATHIDDPLALLLLEEVVDEERHVEASVFHRCPDHLLHGVFDPSKHRVLDAVVRQACEADLPLRLELGDGFVVGLVLHLLGTWRHVDHETVGVIRPHPLEAPAEAIQ